jgi:hypothetical protein
MYEAPHFRHVERLREERSAGGFEKFAFAAVQDVAGEEDDPAAEKGGPAFELVVQLDTIE